MSGTWMWLAVAAAGGLGAVARHLVDLGAARLGADPSPPAAAAASNSASPGTSRPRSATMVVNVTGSLLAGVVAGSAIAGHLGVEAQAVVAGGFLGAYTTFSTAMFQAVAELEARRPGAAITTLIATLVLTVAAAWAGLTITT